MRGELPLDLATLRVLLQAADAEAQRPTTPYRLLSVEALQMELWRQRRPLLTAAERIQSNARRVIRPFARVAELLDGAGNPVLLSLRVAHGPVDYVQLRASDFVAAQQLLAPPPTKSQKDLTGAHQHRP